MKMTLTHSSVSVKVKTGYVVVISFFNDVDPSDTLLILYFGLECRQFRSVPPVFTNTQLLWQSEQACFTIIKFLMLMLLATSNATDDHLCTTQE